MVTSLRHFIHWRHPAVLLSEISEWEQPVVYEVGGWPLPSCQRWSGVREQLGFHQPLWRRAACCALSHGVGSD